MLDGRARGTAAVVGLGEELQLADTSGPRDGDLLIAVHRERGQPVDVGRREAGIVEAVNTASAANRSSLRPESLEKSVAQMPTMAARPLSKPDDIRRPRSSGACWWR